MSQAEAVYETEQFGRGGLVECHKNQYYAHYCSFYILLT